MTERGNNLLLGGVGIGLFLIAWEIIGRERLLGLTWPALSSVLAVLADPARHALFERALAATLSAFALGYSGGVAFGIAAAALGHLVPRMQASLDRTNAFVHAIPSVALAPLLIVLLGRSGTPAALAALGSFFIVYVSATSALATTPRALRDLVAVLGGGIWVRFWRVDLPAALPVVVSGLRLAAPAALIGVIIGEWFGAPRGLGVLVINAMQNFQIALLWSTVLLAVLVSLALFTLLGAVQRAVASRFRG